MGAKEPCIDCKNKVVDTWGYLCDLSCGKRSAWINYKAGIQAVVEWIQELQKNNWFSTKDSSRDLVTFHITDEMWQAKLKSWNISA